MDAIEAAPTLPPIDTPAQLAAAMRDEWHRRDGALPTRWRAMWLRAIDLLEEIER